MDAVMDALLAAESKTGASGSPEIAERWTAYRAALDSGKPRQRTREYRSLQRSLTHTLDRKTANSVPLASGAVSLAVEAVMAWDLTSVKSGWSRQQRSLLMRPWLTVFTLPEGLAD
jgi:hypothetical protein